MVTNLVLDWSIPKIQLSKQLNPALSRVQSPTLVPVHRVHSSVHRDCFLNPNQFSKVNVQVRRTQVLVFILNPITWTHLFFILPLNVKCTETTPTPDDEICGACDTSELSAPTSRVVQFSFSTHDAAYMPYESATVRLLLFKQSIANCPNVESAYKDCSLKASPSSGFALSVALANGTVASNVQQYFFLKTTNSLGDSVKSNNVAHTVGKASAPKKVNNFQFHDSHITPASCPNSGITFSGTPCTFGSRGSYPNADIIDVNLTWTRPVDQLGVRIIYELDTSPYKLFMNFTSTRFNLTQCANSKTCKYDLSIDKTKTIAGQGLLAGAYPQKLQIKIRANNNLGAGIWTYPNYPFAQIDDWSGVTLNEDCDRSGAMPYNEGPNKDCRELDICSTDTRMTYDPGYRPPQGTQTWRIKFKATSNFAEEVKKGAGTRVSYGTQFVGNLTQVTNAAPVDNVVMTILEFSAFGGYDLAIDVNSNATMHIGTTTIHAANVTDYQSIGQSMDFYEGYKNTNAITVEGCTLGATIDSTPPNKVTKSFKCTYRYERHSLCHDRAKIARIKYLMAKSRGDSRRRLSSTSSSSSR